MAWTKVDGWSGRVWVDSRGKRVFYIRQWRDGKRWDVSTKASTLRGAMKELERFETLGPESYRPAGSGDQLVLDDEMIEAYAKWCMDKTDSEDYRWLDAKRRYLAWWKGELKGKPLNAVTLSRLLEVLDGQPSQKDRIVSIKHLYTYLRQTDQLSAGEDPTLDALPVPQSKPQQDTTGKSKVIPEDDFRKALPLMDEVHADLCRLMAGTGCHLSEALRFMAAGAVDGLVVAFRHKGGHIHRVLTHPSVAAAAARLVGKPPPGRETVYKAIRTACRGAGVALWTPGRFRHTFATSAVQRGVAPSAVALALGHTSPATTLSWYATTAAAPAIDGGYIE